MEAALEELYGTEPGDFTKARDAIAKRLKAAGDTEAASSIRARRKPTQIAWVLNQLARRHPDEVAELVDVGRELAREQRKALRGDASASFRESIDRQRKVIGDVTRTAAKLMADLGVTPAGHLDEVASALRAALVDPVVGAQLEEGRLEKVPEPAAGFAGPMPEAAASLTAARPEPSRPAKAEAAPPTKARADSAAEKAAAKKALAKERAERQAAVRAQKKALAKERAERQATERAQKKALDKALAAVRAAEAEAERRQAEAAEAEEEARRAIERAKKLADAAKASAARAADARKALARVDVS